MNIQEITALCGGISLVTGSLAWIVGGKRKENKLYKENGLDRRVVGIKQCEAIQEKFNVITENLSKGQEEIKDKFETSRKENREDFKILFSKIDNLKKQ